MHPPDLNKLADAIRQDKLTPDQEAQLQRYLVTHPDERGEWEEELALNQLLGRIPDAPVSSNFTSRVLQSIRQSAPPDRVTAPALWRNLLVRGWQAKVAAGLALVCVGVFTYHEQELATQRDLARHLAKIAKETPTPPLELLQNFDAIERLNQVPVTVDRELVAALQ